MVSGSAKKKQKRDETQKSQNQSGDGSLGSSKESAIQKSKSRSVVGPDMMTLMQGEICGKKVKLFLCGEDHNDAIDVTRKDGKFEGEEGWVKVGPGSGNKTLSNCQFKSTTNSNTVVESDFQTKSIESTPSTVADSESNIIRSSDIINIDTQESDSELFKLNYDFRLLKSKTQPLPLSKAKEFATDYMECDLPDDVYDDNSNRLFFIWIPAEGNSATSAKGNVKGKTYVVAVKEVGTDTDDDSDSSDSDSEKGDSSKKNKTKNVQNEKKSNSKLNKEQTRESKNAKFKRTNNKEVNQVLESVLGNFNSNSNINGSSSSDLPSGASCFEWEDLDDEARLLNQARLEGRKTVDSKTTTAKRSAKEIQDDDDREIQMHDNLIEKRKNDRKKQGIWTWDAWLEDTFFDRADSKAAEDESKENVNENFDNSKLQAKKNFHLILEDNVPPWELKMHEQVVKTPGSETSKEDESNHNVNINKSKFAYKIPRAPDFIREMESDSDESDLDADDPSVDGKGSYSGYISRKMYKNALSNRKLKSQTGDSDPDPPSWLHPIDPRDIGSSCVDSSLNLIRPYAQKLMKPSENSLIGCPGFLTKNGYARSPEYEVLEEKGLLKNTKNDSKAVKLITQNVENNPTSAVTVTDSVTLPKIENLNLKDSESDTATLLDEDLPSFEGFFGQISEILLYSPFVKTRFAPFLSTCVGSYETWEKFIVELLFGGTITNAIKILESVKGGISDNNDSLKNGNIGMACIHTRSPIKAVTDTDKSKKSSPDPSQNIINLRENNIDEALNSYFLPLNSYLVSKKSLDPENPTTWSSQLYQSVAKKNPQLAVSIRDWIINKIRRASANPKKSDDGDIFCSYLRAVHRKIYDEIDHTDPEVVRDKKMMKIVNESNNDSDSESDDSDSKAESKNKKKNMSKGKFHNVGSIEVPSVCSSKICEEIANSNQNSDKKSSMVTPKTKKTKSSSDLNVTAPTTSLLFNKEKQLNPEAEVLSKILIDLWVCHLVDFCAVLKVADVVCNSGIDSGKSESNTNRTSESTDLNESVNVVMYMGSAHTQAVKDFFENYCGDINVNFKVSKVVGKEKWPDEAPRKLTLTPEFWSG